MRTLRFAWLALERDRKSGELAVLFYAVVVAVAALTTVAFFTSRIDEAIHRRAAEILAADLRIKAPQPLADSYLAEARRAGLAVARTVSFPSVAFHGEASSLVSLYAVSEDYPLRGRIRVARVPFGPAAATHARPGPGEAWAEARLMAVLGARVGDSISLGATDLRLTRVLDHRPDQGSTFVDLAAGLLIRLEDLPATELLQEGSRSTHALLLAGRPDALDSYRRWAEPRLSAARGEQFVTVDKQSPQVDQAAGRAGRFLKLAAVIAILLAAVSVAMATRRHVLRHLDNVALMKCLGATQSFILRVSLLQLLMIAIIAAVVGSGVGYLAQLALEALSRDLLRITLPAPDTQPALLGLATALLVLGGFAVPPLITLGRVPPVRVLRRDLEPAPLRRLVVYGLAAGSMVVLVSWLLRDAGMVVAIVGGLACTLAVFWVAGWLLVRATGRLRDAVGVSWRYGLANIARRDRESVVQIVAFGVGITVLLLLGIVRNDLLAAWRAGLSPDAPNVFLINIRSEDREGIGRHVKQLGAVEPRFFPMIRARLTHINGEPIESRTLPTERGRMFAEREQNLSWARDVQPDNRIVAGRWWSPGDGARSLVSVASEYQEELGLVLGDRLSFDVAGEPVTAEISSFREVRWDSFRPNFFLVFNPGTLEAMTGTWLTSLRLDAAGKRGLAGLVHEYPGVSVFDVDALLQQVRDAMDRAAVAVQAVFLFTLAAGTAVLLAAVQATRDERRYESAILRTLGARRAVVLKGVATEFLVLGLLAGTLASASAILVGWILAAQVFELRYQADPRVWLWGIVAGMVIVGGTGTLAARGVVRQPPLGTLRGG